MTGGSRREQGALVMQSWGYLLATFQPMLAGLEPVHCRFWAYQAIAWNGVSALKLLRCTSIGF
jgi:cyanate permease